MGWFNSLNSSLSASFAKVREDTNSLFKWITWLKARGDGQQAKLSHLGEGSERMEKEIALLKVENEALKGNLGHVMDYMKLVHREVLELHGEMHTAPSEQKKEDEVLVPKITAVISGGLTEAENAFISHLYNAQKPLSYQEISDALSLNYGTIKNRLNKVKAKGIDIKFMVDASGERRFFLPETAKIRLSGR